MDIDNITVPCSGSDFKLIFNFHAVLQIMSSALHLKELQGCIPVAKGRYTMFARISREQESLFLQRDQQSWTTGATKFLQIKFPLVLVINLFHRSVFFTTPPSPAEKHTIAVCCWEMKTQVDTVFQC